MAMRLLYMVIETLGTYLKSSWIGSSLCFFLVSVKTYLLNKSSLFSTTAPNFDAENLSHL